MERFDLWKTKQNNPDARNIVDIIVSSIIGALDFNTYIHHSM